MLKDVTLGQYLPGESFLYRLDPRIKIGATVISLVAFFSARSLYAFGLLTLLTLLLIFFSGISARVIFRAVRPVITVLLIMGILVLFTTKGSGDPYFSLPVFSLFNLEIYREGVVRAVLFSLRIVLLVISTCLFLTYTTTPTSLTDALASVLSPLTFLRVPVYDFAMMMTLALRFIPTLAEETEKIMSAQKARGADFSSGSLIRRAKALIPILIPLFASSFRRAGELATAMECRCYRGGAGRTKLHVPKILATDILFFLFCGVILAAVYLINAFLPTAVSL